MNASFAYAAAVLTTGCSYLLAQHTGPYAGLGTMALYLTTSIWMMWFAHQAQHKAVSLDDVLYLGILLRVMLLAVPVYTTNDVTRYLWDGAVLVAGFDPYLLHPDHPLLTELRGWWPTPEEHAAYPTLYPPIALCLYGLSALAGPSAGIWAWKLICCGASAASLLVMDRVLAKHQLRHHLPWIALSPIALYEAGIGAHVDAITMLALCVMLWAWTHKRLFLAGICIGIGAATKLLPIVALAPLALHLSLNQQWRCCAQLIGGAAAAAAVSYGSALAFGLKPLGSLITFFDGWRFGSPLYSASEAIVGANYVAWPLAAGLLAGVAWIIFHSKKAPITACLGALSLPLMFSPVVFPWYLMALVPFCALQPNRWLILWLTLSPLTYEVLGRFVAAGLWQPAAWPLWVIGAGWLLGWLFSKQQRSLDAGTNHNPELTTFTKAWPESLPSGREAVR